MALFQFRLKDMLEAQKELRAASQLELSNVASQEALTAACARMTAAIRDYRTAAKGVPRGDSYW
jgi:predicted DNA-binding protein (UPF0251 family)